MAKCGVVVLSANIYLPGEGGETVKCIRGDQVEIDKKMADEILAGDKEAGREDRLTIIKPKRRAKREVE